MFENVHSFFDDAGHFFVNGYNRVTGFPGMLYDDAKTLISGAGNMITHTIDQGHDTIKTVIIGTEKVITNGQNQIGSSISNVSSNLSMPLMLAGGAALLYFLKK